MYCPTLNIKTNHNAQEDLPKTMLAFFVIMSR